MGCFQSLDDKRKGQLEGDWSNLEFAFVPARLDVMKFSPLDALVMNYCKDGDKVKDLKDKFGETLSEDDAKKFAKDVWEGMKKFMAYLDTLKDDDKKDGFYGCYNGKEAYEQMTDCMTKFAENSHCDFKWPEGEAASKPEGMEAMDEGMKEEGMEGGEGEGEAAAGGDAAGGDAGAEGFKAWGEFASATDVPKLLTALYFTCNVFGDCVKYQTMQQELGGGEKSYLAPAAAMIAFYCLGGIYGEGAASETSYAPALLTDDDMAELKQSNENKDKEDAVIFPGAIAPYPSAEMAEKEYYAKEGLTKVMYKMECKSFKPAGANFIVSYRPFFTVASIEEGKDGKPTMVTLTPFTKHVYQDCAAWLAAAEGGAAAAAPVVAAVKDAAEDKPMEGEMAEGEAM